MSMVQDGTYDFTISLLAEEGRAGLVSVDAPSSAYAGEQITVSVTLENIGGTDTYLWARIRALDTYAIVGSLQSEPVPPGFQTTFTWTLTMPPRDWHLRVEYGHSDLPPGPI